MYLENYRDITFLFKNRAEQYHSFYYLMIAMILISGAVIFVITRWLTSPLKTLSKATQQIAGGNFELRVSVQSRDEIGKLSRDFNKMAVKIEQMVEELKESARRQEDFVDSFAHELKTPLTSMIGYADMLRSKILDPEQIVISANYIFEEGKRLEALSMKLMEMIVLKKQDFSIKRISATDFFDDIHGVLQPVMNQENIELITACEDAVLSVEPDLMKTVCINLLDNARKSMNGGGRIFFSGKWVNDHYILAVEDTGKGMAQAELSKITEAFYMVDKSRARAQGGAGLGLAICSAIVKLHGTDMEFESSPGKGTRVTIWLKGAAKS
jgi:signal transduction histidine kinase